jgi:hypothetical protein
LFSVDLKPRENNKDIFLIETLNYTNVKFEPQDQRETYCNVVNAKDTDIPRSTVITAPAVSGVLAVTSPNNVKEKSQKMSNAFSVMVTTQRRLQGLTKQNFPAPTKQTGREQSESPIANTTQARHLLCYCS